MPRLYVLRHGKSDWSADYAGDHERPLAPRGRKAARRIGRFLAAAGEVPDRVLSSTAVRARHTAELAAEAGGWGVAVVELPELYGAGPGDVLGLVRDRAGDGRSVLVAGHEPTCSGLVALLTGARVRFPTAACALIDLAGEGWRRRRAEGGELRWLVIPKLLDRAGRGEG